MGDLAVTEAALRAAMAEASGVEGPPGETRLPPGWVEIARRRIPPQQSRVTLSLDADVAAFFRSLGRGHQARMNDVLRAFMLGCQGGWLPVAGAAREERTAEPRRWASVEEGLAAYAKAAGPEGEAIVRRAWGVVPETL